MDNLIHRAPSVGSVVKKMIAINPELTAPEIIQLIKRSTRTQAQSGIAGDFAQAEVVDEENVLRLTRESLIPSRTCPDKGDKPPAEEA